MARRPILLALALVLAACASSQPRLPEAKGPLRPLNVGRWQPTKADLRRPRAAVAPAQSPSLNAPETRP